MLAVVLPILSHEPLSQVPNRRLAGETWMTALTIVEELDVDKRLGRGERGPSLTLANIG
jgi:hypothetical protein